MRRWLHTALGLGLALLSACVQFDGQDVRIRYSPRRDRIDASNRTLRESLQTTEGRNWFASKMCLNDPTSIRYVQDAARRGYRFFRFRGSALVCSVPATDTGAGEIRRAVLRWVRDEWLKTNEESEALLEFLARNCVSVEQNDGQLALVIGNPTAPEIALSTPFKGKATGNLIGPLTARGWRIEDPGADEAALGAFAAFTREH